MLRNMKTALLLSVSLALVFAVSSASSSSFSILDAAPNLFVHCLTTYSNNATSISENTFTRQNPSFLPVWQFSINNIRFNSTDNPQPLVIITPVDELQVRTVLYCSQKTGIALRIRGSGHDFEGLSYTNPTPLLFVMMDLRNLKSIKVDAETQTAWVQGGATLGEVYYRISEKCPTLGFPGGTWSTVGVSGIISGGGYGMLMRKYGLAADHVLDVRFMDAKGRILDRKAMGEDLFWAIRGGGASSFGVVLAWKLSLVRVPETMTAFLVQKTLEEGATRLLHKWQYVAPNINRNLLIRVQFQSRYITGSTGKKTVLVSFEGVYLGKIDTLLPLMDQSFPELGVVRERCTEMSWIQSVLFFSLISPLENPRILLNRSAVPKLGVEGKSDFVRTPIPIKGFEGLWQLFLENDMSENFVLNPFGGRMSELPESAVPYPNREGTLFMMLEWVALNEQPLLPELVARRMRWIRKVHKYLTPYVSKSPRRQYLNYNDLDVGVGGKTFEEASVWGTRYFNNNFRRLVQVKSKIDPQNFFRHPQSIPVFPEA